MLSVITTTQSKGTGKQQGMSALGETEGAICIKCLEDVAEMELVEITNGAAHWECIQQILHVKKLAQKSYFQ